MKDYFPDDTPAYVTVSNESLRVQQRLYSAIRVLIHKLQPIRKRFHNGQLQCLSQDAKRSTGGEICAFCDNRGSCQRKLRMSMLMIDGNEPTPVVFDLNQSSFPSLQDILRQHGENALKTQVVVMKLVYDDQDRKRVEFTLE